jgi:hypothetical protein
MGLTGSHIAPWKGTGTMRLDERKNLEYEAIIYEVSRRLWSTLTKEKEFRNLYPGYFLTVARLVKEAMDEKRIVRSDRPDGLASDWKDAVVQRVIEGLRTIFSMAHPDWPALLSKYKRQLSSNKKELTGFLVSGK